MVSKSIPRGLIACVLSLVMALGLAACGDAKHSSGTVATDPAPSSTQSGGVVATIAGQPITKAEYDHELEIWAQAEAPSRRPAPVPPDFSVCISKLKVEFPKDDASALKAGCKTEYTSLQTDALDALIVEHWIIGGAKEEGVSLSERELKAQYLDFKKTAYPTAAKYAAFEASTKQTPADVMRHMRVRLLSEKLRSVLKDRVPPMTVQRARAYFEAHQKLYEVPASRDLEIVKVTTPAAGRKAKREIENGRSFASVVKAQTIPQPIFSVKGLVIGLGIPPRVYSEPPLTDAIFAAKPNVVRGPVKIVLGYYVFEVKRIIPAHEKIFAEVVTTIKSAVQAELQAASLTGFIARWRLKWTPKTDCKSGYVVSKCKQYRAPVDASEDPFTLD